MKNSNLQRNIVFSLIGILLVLLSACNQDEPTADEVRNNPKLYAAVLGTGIDGHAYDKDPQLSFVLEGSESKVISTIDTEGTSTNADFANFRLSQSHIAYYNTSDDQIRISEGEFVINGEGEATLYGTYAGTGQFDNGYFAGELTLAIKGGTGICSNAFGSITETIVLSDKLDEQMAPIGFYIDFAGVYCSPRD